MTVRVLHGDCRAALATLPSASVHCCVTSPPYYRLRAYLPDGHADKPMEIGLEQTPEDYVAALVAVFREARRVMRPDATLWLNLGDSYCGSQNENTKPRLEHGNGKGLFHIPDQIHLDARSPVDKSTIPGLKPKDLIGIPWRVAFALQADGWFLRQDIIWSKPSPMPESVRDRCTKAHEYVFLLSKSARYYYDDDAISEPAVSAGEDRGGGHSFNPDAVNDQRLRAGLSKIGTTRETRNKRSVWTIATEPTSLGHFALMPSALAEVCIKAGTSERGCCPTCGAPWVREMEREREATRPGNPIKADVSRKDGGRADRVMTTTTTLGWSPSCACPAHTPRPCTVLDPFGGAGTTGLVADRLGRDAILIELSLAHAATARRRIEDDAGMFANVAQAAE